MDSVTQLNMHEYALLLHYT